MHALMPAVLLRLTGCDTLELDSQTHPPDRQWAEPLHRARRERHAVIAANTRRQPILSKHHFETLLCTLRLRTLQRFAADHIPAMKVGDGQRIAVLRIPHAELPLEVGAPQLVGCLDVVFPKRRVGRIASSFGALLDQSVAIQQIVNRAAYRQFDLGMLASQHLLNLPSSPCRLLPFQLQDRRLNSRRNLTCQSFRPSRNVVETFGPVFFVTLFKLVAGLARYPEFAAQIRHPFARFESGYKLHSFVHCGNLFPGHGPSSTLPKVLAMSPVIFVTYVSGLHRKLIARSAHLK